VHCAKGSAFCADAKGVKFGQAEPSPTAVPDVLPDEPGGYQGFQALFGHRYVAPQLGAGTPDLKRHGYLVTNAAGNLVDENGNQLNGAFLADHPGFPGFGPVNASQTLAYMADSLEAGVPIVNGYIILHMVNADPARTPTFALFAKPDYFFTPGLASCSPCVTQNTGFAWDHGDYAAEINTSYAAFAGPGVKHLGLDGQAPATGPSSAGPDSGQIVAAGSGTTGTWMDETDIRPTLLYLTGLKDDYEHDGRVVTQILSRPNRALAAPGAASLGACYKQLNSSVGQFGNFTQQASTAAGESSTPGDAEYRTVNAALAGLDRLRDSLALRVKGELEAAAVAGQPIIGAAGQVAACQGIIAAAGALAQHL